MTDKPIQCPYCFSSIVKSSTNHVKFKCSEEFVNYKDIGWQSILKLRTPDCLRCEIKLLRKEVEVLIEELTDLKASTMVKWKNPENALPKEYQMIWVKRHDWNKLILGFYNGKGLWYNLEGYYKIDPSKIQYWTEVQEPVLLN